MRKKDREREGGRNPSQVLSHFTLDSGQNFSLFSHPFHTLNPFPLSLTSLLLLERERRERRRRVRERVSPSTIARKIKLKVRVKMYFKNIKIKRWNSQLSPLPGFPNSLPTHGSPFLSLSLFFTFPSLTLSLTPRTFLFVLELFPQSTPSFHT